MKPFLAVTFSLQLLFCTAPVHAALPGADALAKLILSQFDANSDSKVDTGEWNEGLSDSFASLDTDGDDSIEMDEIDGISGELNKEAGEAVGVLMTALIKQVLLSLDTNGDKLISKEEFTKLSDAMFAKLDADKDTMLTEVELAELPTKILLK
ncbi:MAG: hypothetical protein KDK97_08960 [Verrucomicrobiales bacterium]|nr:hypothetical protein [Verrucomicrobiales bacterium]MCP5560137.1 hypothetical protein [Verrucomicrobiaceae bacterium]